MKNEIICIIISSVLAVIAGYLSGNQAYKREIKKSIYEEREKLYVELFVLLDNLQRYPEIMYDFTKFIKEYKVL